MRLPAFARRAALPGIAALALASAGGAALARPASVEEAKEAAPPLTLTPVKPETFRLKNGITVYFLENRRLPLVTVRAVVRAGSVWEPAGENGIAEVTGDMLRRGGAGTRGPDEVDDQLDFLAAELSSTIGIEQGSVTLSCLTQTLDESLGIFADVIRRPRFDESKLEVQKNLVKEELLREKDNPIQVALVQYAKLLWGDDHPRARRPTDASVDAIGRDDCVAFHERFFRPSGILLGVAGDVSKKDIQKKLEKAFGDWKGETVELPSTPPTPPVEPRVAIAVKAVPQSTILVGHLGPREDDPHRASGQVMMSILGDGGFASYITDRVRNDEGLAYAAGGVLNFGRVDAGAVVGFALTKSASTCRATDLILEQFERIRNEPVTDEELARAKNSILNSRAFDFDSSEEIVRDFMDLVYYGLPENHSETVLEGIGRVTKDDVKAAANALIDPSKLSILAVGDPEKLDCPWSRYAERAGVPLRTISIESAP
jgi:predicted Zn-dependent peptidase